MTSQHSVTQLLADLKRGDEQAAARLAERYLSLLVDVARDVYFGKFHGMPRPVEDEEDAALSALGSFIERAKEDAFRQLLDRNDLWNLLVMITVRKVYDQRERAGRVKRGGPRSDSGDQQNPDIPPTASPASSRRRAHKAEGMDVEEVVDRLPGPEAVAELKDTYCKALTMLPDSLARQIAQMDLEGKTREEIATACRITERAVYRKLKSIHELWNNRFADAQ